MHMAQREDSQVYIRKVVQALLSTVPLELMIMVLTMDMSQNGTVPSLGVDHCGDFYHISQPTKYMFGICNEVTHFTDCYMDEGTAAQGADNLVLCLNSYLMKFSVVNAT